MKPTTEQISRAILNGKDFFNGIKLPSPQKHGTFYQCNSYAKQCAAKIFEEHFRFSST